MSRHSDYSVYRLICLFLFCVLPLNADAELDKGLVAGWNQSDWDHTPPHLGQDMFEPINGFCAGAYLGGKVSTRFGWRGEILYTRKGAVLKDMFVDENAEPQGEVKRIHQVDYLEIPFLVTWTIPTRGAVRPVFYLGPALDFELSSRIETEYPTGVRNPFTEEPKLSTSSSTDFSLIFGGGIDIDAGGKVINLQVRYVMGTLEVYHSAKNKTLSVMAGFGI